VLQFIAAAANPDPSRYMVNRVVEIDRQGAITTTEIPAR
jgi:hypothetical protein